MNSTNAKNNLITGVLPVLFCFFIMGFVDFVGTATNYVKDDFNLSDSLANTLPMIVFAWFAIFSIPTGILMNKIGRKNTVMISLVITLFGLIIPVLTYNFPAILLAFALIGIGNTVMQTSLNPLVTNVVSPKKLTSSLTLGQFVKAIASFLGPVLAAFTAKQYGDWKITFIIFTVTTVLSGIWLYLSPIPKEEETGTQVSYGATLSLLKDKYILFLFLGILFIVGIDVGLNTSIPKLLKAKLGMETEQATQGTFLYFIARTSGAFIGAMLLARFAGNIFLKICMLISITALAGLLLISNIYSMSVMIFIIGFACANVFSIIFSYALRHKEESANEISALMIMGVAGGALITPIMGGVADIVGSFAGAIGGQVAGMAVLSICMIYLLYLSNKLKA